MVNKRKKTKIKVEAQPQPNPQPNIRHVGRPSRLTDELINAIYNEVIQGAGPNNACRAFGVSKQLKSIWVEQGKKDSEANKDTLLARFYIMIDIATGKALARAEQMVYAGTDNWQSSARWLESMDAENWRKTTAIAGDKDAPIILKVVEE